MVSRQHTCVEHEDVDVLAAGHHVVQAAKADVVGPAVAADDPQGGLHQLVLLLVDLPQRVHTRLRHNARGVEGADLRLQQVNHRLGDGDAGVGVLPDLCPPGESLLELGRGREGLHGQQGTHVLVDGLASGLGGGRDAEAKLGVVLKQRVGPGGAVALRVGGVGVGGGGSAPDGAAAGGVSHDEVVTKHLCHQLHVGRLLAALAGAAELQQRGHKLAAAHRGAFVQLVAALRQLCGKVPVGCLLGQHVLQRGRDQGAGGAGLGAQVAASAVGRGHLDAVLEAADLLALATDGGEARGG
mmetsp:Transcript_33286/g.94304  ORF Transcript_33286/g.94304 Transcript_33286/m.94304 type:complete len:298 (+) Transcript_33286:1969-2862(+)